MVKLIDKASPKATEIEVVGQTAAGASGVRLLWNDGHELRGLADLPVDGLGQFDGTVVVPADAVPGDTQVCGFANGPGALGLDLSCADFTVLPTVPGGIAGQVFNARGGPVGGASVLLTTEGDLPIARTTTNGTGQYTFHDVAPGRYVLRVVASGAAYFPPLTKEVKADVRTSAVHRPAAAPDVTAYHVGAIALLPERAYVSEPANGYWLAHFASLPGAAPLTVRFFATVLFPKIAAQAVLFSIRNGDSVVTSQVSLMADRVLDESPFNLLLDSYFADFNVSELPPGDLTLRLSGYDALNGVELEIIDEFHIDMADLGGRWLSGYVKDPSIAIATDSATRVAYQFAGILPNAFFAFDFRQDIDLPFDITLENRASLGVPIRETFYTDNTWSGDASASAQLKLLGYDLLGTKYTRAYVGPTGDAFATATYQFDPPLTASLLSEQCAPVPFLSFDYRYSVNACYVDCKLEVGISAGVFVCVEVSANTFSTLEDDLRIAAKVVPDAALSVPIKVDVDAVVCSGDANVKPRADVSLDISYDPVFCPECAHFDNPCLDLTASAHYRVKCLKKTIKQGDIGFGHIKYGCSGSGSSSASTATSGDDTDAKRKDVATDGMGHALAVWVQDDSSNPTSPDVHLYYAYHDGNDWSVPLRVTEQSALLDTPRAVFSAPNRAVAVWEQSKLTAAQALAADDTTLLSSSELFYAVWNGQAWSTPSAITNDDVIDSRPVLAAASNSGAVMLAWLRGNPVPGPGKLPFALHYATFDGSQWNVPAAMDPLSTAFDRQVALAFDAQGQAWAVWVRDLDGDLSTSADRELVLAAFGGGTWGAPQTIPNLPPGAYTPSLAFDNGNNPIIAFVEPGLDLATGRLGTGDGNTSRLYAARRVTGTWQVTPVGDAVYAERPIVRATGDGRAVIIYRQFGTAFDVHLTGDVAAAVRNLDAPLAGWTSGFLTADGQTNWQVAFDIDRQTGKSFIVNTKEAPGGGAAALRSSARAGGGIASTLLAPGDTTVASIVVPFAADLGVSPSDITFSDIHPLVGDLVTITATVHNLGLKETSVETPFTVAFFDDDVLVGQQTVAPALPFNSAVPVSTAYTLQRGGLHNIRVVVDRDNGISESDETNNSAAAPLGRPPAPVNLSAFTVPARGIRPVLHWAALPLRGFSRYRVYRSTTPGSGYELVGGTVDTEFVDALAIPGAGYYYVVAAMDIYGVLSQFSEEAKLALRTAACTGDCDADGAVTVGELLTGVNVALGNMPVDFCTAFDANFDHLVTVDEVLASVNTALNGCPDPSI